MRDGWEMQYFNTFSRAGDGDFDSDGLVDVMAIAGSSGASVPPGSSRRGCSSISG